jgi:hypothetical protein
VPSIKHLQGLGGVFGLSMVFLGSDSNLSDGLLIAGHGGSYSKCGFAQVRHLRHRLLREVATPHDTRVVFIDMVRQAKVEKAACMALGI